MSHRPGREATYTVSKAQVVAAWPETKPKAPRHVATARNSPSRAQHGRGRSILFLSKVATQSEAAKAATRVIKSQNQALSENFGRWTAHKTSQMASATQVLETAVGPPRVHHGQRGRERPSGLVDRAIQRIPQQIFEVVKALARDTTKCGQRQILGEARTHPIQQLAEQLFIEHVGL